MEQDRKKRRAASAAVELVPAGRVLGGGAAGWLLAGFCFVANADQTPETLRGLRLMMSFIPAAAADLGPVLADGGAPSSCLEEVLGREAFEDLVSRIAGS